MSVRITRPRNVSVGGGCGALEVDDQAEDNKVLLKF